ncbi:MAG TPA: hypothetical protein PKA38_03835 [Candidatus Levybacteria bacterium]|nr:hypothetical protein [Candidatus Levybacteria bacterium]
MGSERVKIKIQRLEKSLGQMQDIKSQIDAGEYLGKSPKYTANPNSPLVEFIKGTENQIKLSNSFGTIQIPNALDKVKILQDEFAREEQAEVLKAEEQGRIRTQIQKLIEAGAPDTRIALMKNKFSAEYGVPFDISISSPQDEIKDAPQEKIPEPEKKEAESTSPYILSKREIFRVTYVLKQLNGSVLKFGEDSMRYNLPREILEACQNIIDIPVPVDEKIMEENVSELHTQALDKVKQMISVTPEDFQKILNINGEDFQKVIEFIRSQKSYIFDLANEENELIPNIAKQRLLNGFEINIHSTHKLDEIRAGLTSYGKKPIDAAMDNVPDATRPIQRTTVLYKGHEIPNVTPNVAKTISILEANPETTAEELASRLGLKKRGAISVTTWAREFMKGIENSFLIEPTISEPAEKHSIKPGEYISVVIKMLQENPSVTVEEIGVKLGRSTEGRLKGYIAALLLRAHRHLENMQSISPNPEASIPENIILGHEQMHTLPAGEIKDFNDAINKPNSFADILSIFLKTIANEKSIDELLSSFGLSQREVLKQTASILGPIGLKIERGEQISNEEQEIWSAFSLLGKEEDDSTHIFASGMNHIRSALGMLPQATITTENPSERLPITEADGNQLSNSLPDDDRTMEENIVSLKSKPEEQDVQEQTVNLEKETDNVSTGIQDIQKRITAEPRRKRGSLEDRFDGIGDKIREQTTKALEAKMERFTLLQLSNHFNIHIVAIRSMVDDKKLVKPERGKDSNPSLTRVEAITLGVIRKIGKDNVSKKDAEEIAAIVEKELGRQLNDRTTSHSSK